LAKNPFPHRAPIYIRAWLYKYHYTELPRNITSLSDVVHNNRLVKTWWFRESVREYLPIVAVNDLSLIRWLNQYGWAKNDPWPERPSGRLYKAIKYLRSIVRTLDAFRFMMSLFACGVLMGVFNRHLSRKQQLWIRKGLDSLLLMIKEELVSIET